MIRGWNTDTDTDSEQEIESIPEISLNIDVDNDKNYTKIMENIYNTVNNNQNKRINLILRTKLDTKLDTKLNTNCEHKIFYVNIYNGDISIKIYLYEDTYCEDGLFEYEFNDFLISRNDNIVIKTDYLLIILLFLVIIQYRITQINKYNKEDIDKTYNKINDYLSIHNKLYEKVENSYYNDDWGIENYQYEKRKLTKLLNLIIFRIKHTKDEDLLISRSIKSIFGKFDDTISPNMIQKIFTWLKRKNLDKYKNINRGTKEEILIELKNHGVHVNADLLCEFIDDKNNIPSKFVKEWNINLYSNGKRLKNTELRKLFKKEFYKREKEYNRFKIICPRLNSLPQNIEHLIMGYLIVSNEKIKK